jgi:putative transposase
VVGWHLDRQMPTELMLIALEQALTLRQPAPSLIIHADPGGWYTNSACRTRIERAQALASYSRPGNPYDNAQAEAGWNTLKTDLFLHGGVFASLESRPRWPEAWQTQTAPRQSPCPHRAAVVRWCLGRHR